MGDIDLKDLPSYIDRLWNKLITSDVPTDFGNITYYGLLRDALLMVRKLAITWNEKSADFDEQISQAISLIEDAQNLLDSINIDIEAIQTQVNEALQDIKDELAVYLESDEFIQQINNAVNNYVTDERLQEIIASMKPFHFKDISLESEEDKTAFNNAVSTESNALIRNSSNDLYRTLEKDLILNNNVNIKSKLSTGNLIALLLLTSSNIVNIGDTSVDMLIKSKTRPSLMIGSETKQLAYKEDIPNDYVKQSSPEININVSLTSNSIKLIGLLNDIVNCGDVTKKLLLNGKDVRPSYNNGVEKTLALYADIPEIVDNLTTTDKNKGLSANQGKILNDSITVNSNNINELNEYETGKVESTIGTVTYVKRGKYVHYYIQVVTSSTNDGTSGIATVPYFNKDQQFFGGAIMRVATTPVEYACVYVGTDGGLNIIHKAYGSQVEFVGGVTVILKDEE